MISRTLRASAAVAGLASLLSLATVAVAAANTIHPAPTCIEPSSCDPVSPFTILILLVAVLSRV